MGEEKELYEIGDRIKKLRRSRGISQMCFAEEVGVSEKTISRIENGTTAINILLLLKMTKVLNVKLTEIVGTD